MARFDRFLTSLGSHKDGIGVIIAVLLLLVGGYQYFDNAVDSRIEKGLDVLKRREARPFVDARTTLMMKWFENEDLRDRFAQSDTYTRELIAAATKAIFEDEEYRTALANISTYYSNAAACAIDGICDAPVMCASLMGEVQDFLDVNRGYFVSLTVVRREDATTLFLSLPEFVKFCNDRLFINVASRHDFSAGCKLGRYLERFLGASFGFSCGFYSTEYAKQIEKEAEQLRKQCPGVDDDSARPARS